MPRDLMIPAEYLISTLINYEKKYFSMEAISCWELSIILEKLNQFIRGNHLSFIEKYNVNLQFSDAISELKWKDDGTDFENEFLVRKNHFYYDKKNKKPSLGVYPYLIYLKINSLLNDETLILKFIIEAKELILTLESNFFSIEEKSCMNSLKKELFDSEKNNSKRKIISF